MGLCLANRIRTGKRKSRVWSQTLLGSSASFGYFAAGGSQAAHLTENININQAPLGEGIAGLPFPAFSSVTYIEPISHSSYNALYAKVEQRYSNGLTFLAAYTWSKSLDNATGTPQNIYNMSAERGLSGFDVRNRFVVSPVYQLPFGEGRKFLTNGPASAIFGGFELAANISIQDGTPVTAVLGANVSQNGSTTTADRPNQIGNPNNGPKTIKKWFNTAAFASPLIPATGTTPAIPAYGNAPRNSITSPSYEDMDLNLSRQFVLPREKSLQFRAEFFNLFNHPNFGLPGATFGTSSFGTISSALASRDIQFALKLAF